MLGIRRHNRERELADALSASLEAIRGGGSSVDDCLQRYSSLAAELEPLLNAGSRMQALSRITPNEQARLNARFALMRSAAASRRPVSIMPRAAVRRRSWLALAPAGIAVVLFAAVAVPVLGSIDTNAVPGDWNYSFKRATERVRLAIATDPTDRRLLRIEFARRRLTEIERLSSNGQVDVHAGEITALIKNYSSDLSQVATAAQTQGLIQSSEKQQLEAVTSQAQAVLQPIAENATQDKPVKAVAQEAVSVTKQANSVVKAIPTQQAKQSNQASPSPSNTPTPAPPVPADVSSAASATASATPSPASPTAAPSPTPSATPSATATSTNTVGAAPTREAAVLTPVPTAPPARPAQTQPATEPATTTAGVPVAARTSTSEPPAASIPVRSVVTATATPVPTRAAPIEAGLIVRDRGPESIVYQWTGAATSLDQIVAPLGNQVVFVTYLRADGQSVVWYPGTAAPVIGPSALLTVKLRVITTPTNGR
ncbi:MAG TPA: DUF5667 domain-containing protein [Dehalococcoidia bacterium]